MDAGMKTFVFTPFILRTLIFGIGSPWSLFGAKYAIYHMEMKWYKSMMRGINHC